MDTKYTCIKLAPTPFDFRLNPENIYQEESTGTLPKSTPLSRIHCLARLARVTMRPSS